MDGLGETLKATIDDNLVAGNDVFRPALADLLAAEPHEVDGMLNGKWATPDEDFLKLYAVGLTKFLLSFYAAGGRFYSRPTGREEHCANLEGGVALGDIIRFQGGHYDIRGIVDGRFVVRFRNEVTGKQDYRVWTAEEREQFDAENRKRADRNDRNAEIYERLLAEETQTALGAEFGLSPGRIRQIAANRAHKEKRSTKTGAAGQT